MVHSEPIELPREWPVYGEETIERMADLIRTSEVFDYAGEGPVRALEAAVSARHEGRLTLSFNSGTSALFAAYAGVGVGPGDEVLVANLTFLATATPLLWLGATPVLCDSGEGHPNVDVDTLARQITPRTRAIAVTHLYGDPVDAHAIAALARESGLALVEDCSHAHASTIHGRPVGLSGDAAVYSLGARKMVSGGHGGVLVTERQDVHDTAMLLGHFKPRTRAAFAGSPLAAQAELGYGGNLRMSPPAALLALDHLERLESLSAARSHHVENIDAALAGRLEPVRARWPGRNGTWYDLVYRLPSGVASSQRDVVIGALVAAGVPARVPSTRPLDRALVSVADAGASSSSGAGQALASWASAVARRPPLTVSHRHHERAISLPASRLWSDDPSASVALAERLATLNWSDLVGAT